MRLVGPGIGNFFILFWGLITRFLPHESIAQMRVLSLELKELDVESVNCLKRALVGLDEATDGVHRHLFVALAAVVDPSHSGLRAREFCTLLSRAFESALMTAAVDDCFDDETIDVRNLTVAIGRRQSILSRLFPNRRLF